ncbi:MAG: Holliday junction branch migration protein RuvA [Firmicutes bacterium]|nr:Holliday junction branch migration protein RuvA [Bacillota bacterium]
MIAFVDGIVSCVEDDAVVLDVGGVGYRVYTATGVLNVLREGERTRLFTHQHVREDALVLYGFLQDGERRLFLRLQSATGVGPKLALSMFSHLAAGQIVQALRLEDARTLTSVPGIGAKTASRMSLELKDRLDDLNFWEGAQVQASGRASTAGKGASALPPGLVDIQEALLALGYQERETTALIAELADELTTLSLSDGVRRALRALSP